MSNYRILQQLKFSSGKFALVPIRMEDRYDIMRWRNEQIYHLRQTRPLTQDDQDRYFSEVVSQLFHQEQPEQILFSFLEDDQCIGYGGLVHINWKDRNAELSFIMDTFLESTRFNEIWEVYLDLIEKVAFQDLNLHKIYTYAFDLRPHLYEVIEKAGFYWEARLKEHVFFESGYIDVLIHSKLNNS